MQPERDKVSEESLLAKAFGGDSWAFGELYQLYLEPIYRYIYFRVGDVEEAEDLTETVFIKAWEALSGIRLQGFNFRAWIYRIAHNLVVDRHRTYKLNVSLDQFSDLEDSNDSPEAAYQQIESSSQLANAISRLEPDLQQVILLRFVVGLNHMETAAVLQRNEVHVRVMQHRAIKKIKQLLHVVDKNVEEENEG